MAISIAFFGLGIGALLVHLTKNKIIKEEKLPSKILQSSIAFAISLPIFLFVIGHVIPPSISFIYLFYLASAIPFFLGGMSMALAYLAMPREVSKLYFVDLAGAAGATLILDPLLQRLGAESSILFISVLITCTSVIVALAMSHQQKKGLYRWIVIDRAIIEKKLILYGIILLSASVVLLAANSVANILAIQPGEDKAINSYLAHPPNKDLSTRWNSFSRIDVIGPTNRDNTKKSTDLGSLSVLIDADALTPVLRWNGSSAGLQWLKKYMDYMPYEISNVNNSNTLVIGSGGGEDILVALAAGSKNITAVELNPLIVSAAKDLGSWGGNLYDRKDVHLFIDDGRRFISSTNSKYDTIVIKLVDSWAAQLAGGYALSENYLYTVEAFKQYLQHLNGNNGRLVMVRWSTELPRLIPLVLESLRQEEPGRSTQDIMKQVLVVQDHPGLTFQGGGDFYPVLIIVKNNPFTNSELTLARERIARDSAKVIAIPGSPGIATLATLPSDWDDTSRNCGHIFNCTSNSTTGWKDNTSFQLSMNTANKDTWSYITGKEISVNPGEHYQLITHMKLNRYATQSHIVIERYNEVSKKWEQGAQITQCPSGINGPLEWKEFSCKITIPKDTTKIRPVLNAGWSSQPGKEAVTLFDAIYLSKIYPSKVSYIDTTSNNNLVSNSDFVDFNIGRIISSCQFRGDFDAQASYNLLDGPQSSNLVRLSLIAQDNNQTYDNNQYNNLDSNMHFPGHTTNNTAGELRMIRSGSVVEGYYYGLGKWIPIYFRSASTMDVNIILQIDMHGGLAQQPYKIAFDDHIIKKGRIVNCKIK